MVFNSALRLSLCPLLIMIHLIAVGNQVARLLRKAFSLVC